MKTFDREQVVLTKEERDAVLEYIARLVVLEKDTEGAVVARCDNSSEPMRKYFERRWGDDTKKAERCVRYINDKGGYCNCEVLYNAYFCMARDVEQYIKDHDIKPDITVI